MSKGIEALLKAGIPVNIMSRDPYNEAYSGMNVMINHQFEIVFREGRSTPQKKGHFVTLWKKDIQDLQNIPYCLSDLKDGLLIYVSDESNPVFFAICGDDFDKLKILKSAHTPGKMGFRVYHPTIVLASSQAQKTQAIMKPYFISVSDPCFKNHILSYYGS
ncbi:MepB family protein [Erysipelothrix piscisicarius]|uniref:MepB family protein n=1 Tax=Erysipelothrix piscisicarius TaxID=2485784 RepID=A0A3Q8S2X5_9FIRM|nr:MepB family protein [Erysipelothrix piscisicarius]AZK44394.1 MepB family protein [Erysipelothrix piscisicarius]